MPKRDNSPKTPFHGVSRKKSNSESLLGLGFWAMVGMYPKPCVFFWRPGGGGGEAKKEDRHIPRSWP